MLKQSELWRILARLHQSHGGHSREDARDLVIAQWLSQGDVGPLLEAIDAGEVVGIGVLRFIALMLRRDTKGTNVNYHLEVKRKPGKRGARNNPGRNMRDVVIAMVYEDHVEQVGSKQALKDLEEWFGLGEKAIGLCVTRYRRAKKTQRPQAIDLPTLNKS
jgi:hypothetical protein